MKIGVQEIKIIDYRGGSPRIDKEAIRGNILSIKREGGNGDLCDMRQGMR